jgi:hypothetical protein
MQEMTLIETYNWTQTLSVTLMNQLCRATITRININLPDPVEFRTVKLTHSNPKWFRSPFCPLYHPFFEQSMQQMKFILDRGVSFLDCQRLPSNDCRPLDKYL